MQQKLPEGRVLRGETITDRMYRRRREQWVRLSTFFELQVQKQSGLQGTEGELEGA